MVCFSLFPFQNEVRNSTLHVRIIFTINCCARNQFFKKLQKDSFTLLKIEISFHRYLFFRFATQVYLNCIWIFFWRYLEDLLAFQVFCLRKQKRNWNVWYCIINLNGECIIDRTYICIDRKSYYASVKYVYRELG